MAEPLTWLCSDTEGTEAEIQSRKLAQANKCKGAQVHGLQEDWYHQSVLSGVVKSKLNKFT